MCSATLTGDVWNLCVGDWPVSLSMQYMCTCSLLYSEPSDPESTASRWNDGLATRSV